MNCERKSQIRIVLILAAMVFVVLTFVVGIILIVFFKNALGGLFFIPVAIVLLLANVDEMKKNQDETPPWFY